MGRKTVADGIDLTKYIRSIPDWPKEGILFRDITPLLANSKVIFRTAVPPKKIKTNYKS